MKTKKTAKFISLMISIMLSLSVLPIIAFAQELPNARETDEIQLEKEEAASGKNEINAGENKAESETGIKTDTDTDAETEKDTDTETETKDQQTDDENDDLKAGPEAESKEAPENMSADVHVHATSKTNNIIGEVLANMVNNAKDEEDRERREASLKEYPLDPHDLEYYGDSPRVRLLEGGDEEGSNYLAYRDSYLLISEKDSADYTVSYSEDGTEAYISPAIPASELDGKTGVVFLADYVGDDDILVFDGDPTYDGDTMTVPVLTAEYITVNRLFSDGKLSLGEKPVIKQTKSLRGIPSGDYNSEISGTNWSGKVTDFSFKEVDFDPTFDIFDADFAMGIVIRTEMDFEITSTGSSGNDKNIAKIADVNIPIQVFDLMYEYSMLVKFDEHPVHIKGSMNTEFKYSLSFAGANISKFRTPVTIDTFELQNPGDVNKDIEFYIGSRFHARGGVLGIKIPIIDVEIGPLLSVNQDSRGGCYFKVRHEKDLYDEPDRTKNEIHTCAKHGKEGCLHFDVEERRSNEIYFKIDLYFWDKDFDIKDGTETTVDGYPAYKSLTYNSGFTKGYCPHMFYKVPVGVWSDSLFTEPVSDMDVTVSDSLSLTDEEKELVKDKTGGDGQAAIFLPIKNEYRYTVVAGRKIGDVTFSGSKQQDHYIRTDDNRRVNVLIGSENKATIRTKIAWNTDLEKKEVPHDDFAAAVLRREAGTNNDWDRIVEYFTASKNNEWKFAEQTVDRFGTDGSRVFLYEYRVLALQHNGRVIPPEINPVYSFIPYRVDAYVDVIGNLQPEHSTRFYIEYDTKVGDEIIDATIKVTPGKDVQVNKIWRLNEPGREVPVYLSVLQKPFSGWDEKAVERDVSIDWLPVSDPLAEGSLGHSDSTTLSELEERSVLSTKSDISPLSNKRLAINEVNGGNWRITYTVPMFRNGIKMQFCGGEIDEQLMEQFLADEYDLDVDVDVKSFGDFDSVSCESISLDDFTEDANVINMDPIPEGTLRGTVRWQGAYSDWDSIPDTVELTVKKDGIPISENPVILKKSDHSTGDHTWIWTLELQDYDPDAKYTVEEKTEKGRLNNVWVPEYKGLDIFNRHVWHDTVMVEARVSFEGDPGISELTATVKDGSATVNTLKLRKSDGWFEWDNLGGTNSAITIDRVKDISQYKFELPEIYGYEIFYDDPVVTGNGLAYGNLTYSYSARYMKKNQDLTILINKVIEKNGDPDAPYYAYPDDVTISLYRDGVWVKDETIHRNEERPNEWGMAVFTTDNNGNPLRRMDDNGHKYVYTFSEKRVDGFTSEVKMRGDTGDQLVYRIVNKWVGPDHVDVKGTIKWEEDGERTQIRPDHVRLSIVNNKGDYVRSFSVPIEGDETRYESKYLPAKDSDGNPLTYSVLQSKANGYTTTYSTPLYDGASRTWTCDVTNTLTGYFTMTIKKEIDGIAPEDPETYKFSVQPTEGVGTGKVAPEPLNAEDIEITGAETATVDFLLDREGVYYYTFKEESGEDPNCYYDESEKLVIISKITGNDGKAEFNSWVVDNPDDIVDNPDDITDKAELDKLKSDTVTFTNKYPNATVEKKWDIDLEGKDRPESIQAVVQKKSGDKWTNVKVLELSEDNGWKASFRKTDDSAEYRVRELKEETALGSLINELRTLIEGAGGTVYEDVINAIKGSEYYDKLPESIKNAADQGKDKLIKELGTTEDKLYDKLIEKLNLTTVTDRVVYDDEDSDKPKGKDGKDGPETNAVRYHVDDHHTKYKVSYDDKAGEIHNFTIKNKAIVEVDVIKRWLTFGVDDEDLPDSAWLVLMCTPKAEELEAAKAAGVDLSGLVEYEFPVINPESGGRDPISIISELVLGVDINIFKKLSIIPKFAIAKAEKKSDDKDGSWTVHFTDSKYHSGIPVEYKGAELSSEIIRQIIKYVSKGTINLPISYNPFSNYFSIPTKAIRTVLGMTDLDFSGLPEKLLEKAKSLTIEDIKHFGPETILDDDQLMANVINVKVNFDTDEDDPDDEKITISGSKTWDDNDDEAHKRPESITIRLRADGEEKESKTVTADDDWKWEFKDLPKTDDGRKINYTISEDVVEGYTSSVNGADVTNKYNSENPDTKQINVFKVWDDNNNIDGIRPETVTVKLKANDSDTRKTLELSESNNWTGSFTELNVKDGSGDDIEYSIEEETTEVITGTDGKDTYASKISGDASKGFTITNKHTSEKVTISGSKTWDDDNDKLGERPDKIKINLLANDSEVASVETTREGRWKFFFSDQPRKDEQGNVIEYSIKEDEVEGYTTEIEDLQDYKFKITNSLRPRIDINVSKVWDDNKNQDGIRPKSVIVKLLEGGEDTGKTLTLSETNGWKDSFENLYKENKDGGIINYSLEEVKTEIITGTDGAGTYASVISGDASEGFTITNKHTPEKITLSGSKTWDDNDNQDGQRPDSIKVRLLANGQETEAREVGSQDGWKWVFKDLPKYKDGEEIRYVLTEDIVENYTQRIKDMDVTNTHTPDKTQVIVGKLWVDYGDTDGLRPDFVTVHLLADGADTGLTIVLNEANGWYGTFNGLDKNKNGKEIIYSVSEDPVTGYEPDIIDGRVFDAPNFFIIRNIHDPEIVTIEGRKVWEDDDNRDGTRPEKITVRLYHDGIEVSNKEVTADDDWKWSFGHFNRYYSGKPYSFTVGEDKVDDYVSEIKGDSSSGFTVTNKHMPGRTQVNVTGRWDDENNQDGIRPDSVTIKLLANGKDTGKTLELTAKDNWSGTFSELYTKSGGKDIRYTVEQVATDVLTGKDGPGTYANVTTGDADKGFVISNIHTPERINLSGSKTWDDNNDEAHKRPESITVRLRENGTEVASRTVTADDNWEWSFENLPKYRDGCEARYFLTEDLVDGYTSNIDGMAVTNEYTPKNTQVNVYKLWDDFGDNDGKRPESVTVRLLADGTHTGKSLELNEENGWMGSFKDIDKYKEGGALIEYSVEEDAVDEYETSYIRGEDDQSNSWLIINRHGIEKIDISGAKVWDDDDDRDGLRPESITVNLYEDGKMIEQKEVSAKDGWKWSFEDCFRYRNGKELEYTISEDSVENYETSIQGDAAGGFIVTNSYSPKKTSVSVNKVWDDGDNQEGVRPRSVTVRLLADGVDTGRTKRLSWINGWKSSFDDLHVYSKGRKIEYTVEEENTGVITGKDDDGTYASSVSGDAENGFTITNTHTPWYEITYDLNGGEYGGNKTDIVERYRSGTGITIHDAPTRKGYKFLYWKGSEYQPGDKYTVTEDHRFVAQWEKDTVPPGPEPDPNPDPDPDPKPNPDPDPNPDPSPDPDPDPNPNPNPNPSPGPGPDNPGGGPKSGDYAHPMLYVGMFLMSLLIILLVSLKRRRQALLNGRDCTKRDNRI